MVGLCAVRVSASGLSLLRVRLPVGLTLGRPLGLGVGLCAVSLAASGSVSGIRNESLWVECSSLWVGERAFVLCVWLPLGLPLGSGVGPRDVSVACSESVCRSPFEFASWSACCGDWVREGVSVL